MTLLHALGITLSTLVAALGAVRLVTGWSPFSWMYRKVREEYRDGLRDVIDETVGPRLVAIESKVDYCTGELNYNTGHSLKDMVRETSAKLERVAEQLDIDTDRDLLGRGGLIERRRG